jgi:hypothetical protein
LGTFIKAEQEDNLSRIASALLVLSLCLPAYAARLRTTFDLPCATLWPVVSGTVRNSAKYRLLSIDDASFTASYRVGGTFSYANDSLSLADQGNGCELDIKAGYRGLAAHDAQDFTAEVQAALAKLPAAPAQPSSAPNSASGYATNSGAAYGSAASPANNDPSYFETYPPTAPPPGAQTAPTPPYPAQPAPPAAVSPGRSSLAQSAQSNRGSGGSLIGQSAKSRSRSSATTSNQAASQPSSGAGDQPNGRAQLPIDTRIALTVDASCKKDPDPTGFIGNDFYSKCKPEELNQLRSTIAATLAAAKVLPPGNAAIFRLAVTLTLSKDKRPSSFMPFGDFAAGTEQFAATYTVSDSTGQLIHSGTVTHQGSDRHAKDVQNEFAAKIANVAAGYMQ